MFSLIKQIFIELYSLSCFLATKCVSWSKRLCLARLNLIDLNPMELNCFPLIISLDERNGGFNVINDLSTKICLLSKDVNVKMFNMITGRNKAKTLLKHFSCDCKCKCNSATCNSNQKWNNKRCLCECKIYLRCKKNYS